MNKGHNISIAEIKQYNIGHRRTLTTTNESVLNKSAKHFKNYSISRILGNLPEQNHDDSETFYMSRRVEPQRGYSTPMRSFDSKKDPNCSKTAQFFKSHYATVLRRLDTLEGVNSLNQTENRSMQRLPRSQTKLLAEASGQFESSIFLDDKREFNELFLEAGNYSFREIVTEDKRQPLIISNKTTINTRFYSKKPFIF